MKILRNINKTTAVMLLFLLALPARVFSSVPDSGELQKNTPVSIADIRVTFSSNANTIVRVAPASLATAENCTIKNNSLSDLLQGSSFLNLNQPANCFNLVSGKPTVAFKTLTVASAGVLPSLKVLVTRNFYDKPQLLPSAGELPQAVQNFPVLAIAIVLFFLAARPKVLSLIKNKNSFIHQPSVFELLVLRC
jgi:hypothetical protein